jgi:hypothetical protein
MTISRRHHRQRSQSLAEFALVAPVLLLVVFGIVDLGRAVFYYNTLAHAAREGARVAERASAPLPADADVLAAVRGQATGVSVAVNPCPNGPLTATNPPAGSAWVFVTEPKPPATVESAPPPNAPGGEFTAPSSGGCSAVHPAGNNVPLQVTIRYNLVLITPIIGQLSGNRVVMTVAAVYRTEY